MSSILIIEDDESYRNSIEMILQLEGYDVRKASSGAGGIVMIREKRPDLILCDIMMPGMNGYSVLEDLKHDSRIADIPFIFVTALNERNEVRRGMSEGADDYLSKPFSAKELVAAVTGRLHRVEMLRQRHNKPDFEKEYAILRDKISSREMEVLLLVGHGVTSKEIAERLGIRTNTVEAHRANLMKKLEANNAAKLARWAVIAEQMPSTDN